MARRKRPPRIRPRGVNRKHHELGVDETDSPGRSGSRLGSDKVNHWHHGMSFYSLWQLRTEDDWVYIFGRETWRHCVEFIDLIIHRVHD